jgi:hypothetical protein
VLGLIALLSPACAGARPSLEPQRASLEPIKKRLLIHLRYVGHTETEPSDDEAVVRDAAAAPARYVRDVDVVEGDAGAKRIEDCAADVACIAERLREARAALGLVIVANLATKPTVVAAMIVDAASAKIIGREVAETNPREIIAASRSMSMVLLARAGLEIGGKIAITSHPPGAAFTLSSTTSATVLSTDEGALIASPGHYVLSAFKDGYLERSVPVEARRAETTALTIDLEAQGSIFGAWWLWIGLAAVAAGAGTAAFFALRSSSALTLDQQPMGSR